MKYTVKYEFPLNEFIRNVLKIDRLLIFVRDAQGTLSETQLRDFIARILELHSLLCRAEFKNELIKEIDKRRKKLLPLKSVPSIDQNALTNTISLLESALLNLKNIPTDIYSLPLPHLIDTIKQRQFSPAGAFEFDLPAYKSWLNNDAILCRKEAMQLIDAFAPITDTIVMFLNMLRSAADPQILTAEGGFLQLNDSQHAELLIIDIESSQRIYPEISGGKHRVFIRFMELASIKEKPVQTKLDINFTLKVCHL